MQSQLRQILAGRNMSLELRALDSDHADLFNIQIMADRLLPVASCFKAFVVPWYYLNVPPVLRQDGPGSALWDMAVHSSNHYTSVVLHQVAGHVPGPGNALQKFNNFLLSIGMQNGLYAWNVGHTSGQIDNRYQPSQKTGRLVRLGDRDFWIFNVFTASDLAQGFDYIARGEQRYPGVRVAAALRQSRSLLGIPERGFRSPIERVFAPGYIGKQGIIQTAEISTGSVFNDAGLLDFGKRKYILAFMSLAERESASLSALREIMHHVWAMDREIELTQAALQRLPRVWG